MEAEESSVPKFTVGEGSASHLRTFTYKVRVSGVWYKLKVPLTLPYTGNPSELATRLISSHKLPCYVESDLCAQLERFGREETLKYLDQQAEENLYGGSVLEQGSETDQTLQKWVTSFTENNVQFATQAQADGIDIQFSEVYHKLIHSPDLVRLLHLEHTYALAVLELCKARDNALEILQKRHDQEQLEAMQRLSLGGTEADINTMMRAHTLEREENEGVWSSELSQLQDSQRREYREWVLKLHEETDEQVKGQTRRVGEDGGTFNEAEAPPLEESFTIHLGTQQKTMHNVRVLCGDPLDLCRHKSGHTHPAASPERQLTAMSLYSSKLSGLVVMADGRINSLGGIKEAFAKVCHQSTDFHFQDIDVQLSKIQECAVTGNSERKDRKLTESMSSHTSDSFLSRSTSPHSVTSPDRNSSLGSEVTSNSTHLLSPDSSSAYLSSDSQGEGQRSSLLDTTSVSVEPGDFYITSHSNLSNVHMVLHLVTDEVAVQSHTLKSRHPVVLGLKNCLRAAARHDVYHITIPLLLVHTMQPDMTINWCLKRAELIFKCVKGFMLENSSWGDGDSRTIQFLVPSGISKDLFEEFCEMLPKVFRITTSRNLTSRRTSNYVK